MNKSFIFISIVKKNKNKKGFKNKLKIIIELFYLAKHLSITFLLIKLEISIFKSNRTNYRLINMEAKNISILKTTILEVPKSKNLN